MQEIDLLYEELDQWNFQGEEAVFWWRDDDAAESTEALKHLVALSNRQDTPVSLAVIPAALKASLKEQIGGNSNVSVSLHGWAHINHAPDSEKKQELGNHRTTDVVINELKQGFDILQNNFDQQFVPVLVPPWNRIGAEIVSALPQIGLLGLSTYSARTSPEAVDGIWQINTHADIVNWKQNKSFLGAGAIINDIVEHLSARRTGVADRAEPTGILTHHLVHTAESWDFLERLFGALDEHPAATMLSAERVFQTRWRQ